MTASYSSRAPTPRWSLPLSRSATTRWSSSIPRPLPRSEWRLAIWCLFTFPSLPRPRRPPNACARGPLLRAVPRGFATSCRRGIRAASSLPVPAAAPSTPASGRRPPSWWVAGPSTGLRLRSRWRRPPPLAAPPPVNPELDRPVDELELSVATSRALARHGIATLRDLVSRTEAELLVLEGFSPKSIRELKEIAAELQLTLGMK